MKIKNGEIKSSSKSLKTEELLRTKLSLSLYEWFDLKLTDIPEIMKKIGVRSKNYEIKFLEENQEFDEVNLLVVTNYTTYEVEIFRGNMVNPYSHFKISNNGKTKTFEVKRDIQVNEV